MMPGEDGLTLCRNLRASGGPHANTLILMLTARGEDMDHIIALEMAPTTTLPALRAARALRPHRAVLRRTRAFGAAQPSTPPHPPARACCASRTGASTRSTATWSTRELRWSRSPAPNTFMLAVFCRTRRRCCRATSSWSFHPGREADVFRSLDRPAE